MNNMRSSKRMRGDREAEQLSNTETDGIVDIFTFSPEMSTFILSLMNNKLNSGSNERLDEGIFFLKLVSNSNKALEKVERLFEPKPSHNVKYYNYTDTLGIRVELNKTDHTLTFIDNGFGMTKIELIDKIATSTNIDGFQSLYLVADKITVITKTFDHKQYLWESNAHESFTIRYDTGEQLEHGTKIVLHIKEDQSVYLERSKIIDLMSKYWDYVKYGIKIVEK